MNNSIRGITINGGLNGDITNNIVSPNNEGIVFGTGSSDVSLVKNKVIQENEFWDMSVFCTTQTQGTQIVQNNRLWQQTDKIF